MQVIGNQSSLLPVLAELYFHKRLWLAHFDPVVALTNLYLLFGFCNEWGCLAVLWGNGCTSGCLFLYFPLSCPLGWNISNQLNVLFSHSNYLPEIPRRQDAFHSVSWILCPSVQSIGRNWQLSLPVLCSGVGTREWANSLCGLRGNVMRTPHRLSLLSFLTYSPHFLFQHV